MLDQARYGEYFADGTRREPDGSALSGKPVAAGDVEIRVGPHHFVRVKASEKARLARADWDALKAEWKTQFAAAPQAEGEGAVESALPDFESMTVADLKAFAEQNGIDLGARRSQAQLASGIRAALAVRQFEEPAQTPVVTTAPEGSA